METRDARAENLGIAARLEEVAALLENQGANRFRVDAYRRAARTLARLEQPASKIVAREGIDGLDRLEGIGPALSRAIFSIVCTGRLPMLDRLRGEGDPTSVLTSVPGIGPRLADRLHHDLRISSLEELEVAAHDGRLDAVPGLGRKRIAGIRDSLAARLARIPRTPAWAPSDEPPVSELLDVDLEYRKRADAGTLKRIAPRRFNPGRKAWLPILHTQRGERHYTAMFSNTERAHRLGKTRDWVVLFGDGRGGQRQWTVVTETAADQRGQRVVRGREEECRKLASESSSSMRASGRGTADGPGEAA